MKSAHIIVYTITVMTSVLASPIHKVDGKSWSDFYTHVDESLVIPASVKQRAPRNVKFPAKVTFAANDEAWLYVNEVGKKHIADPKGMKEVVCEVQKGDVIALKVRSNGPLQGVVINAEYQGINYPSNAQSNGSWKARKATGFSTSWMSKSYSSCTWQHPVLAADVVKAASFPYETGAVYVRGNPSRRGNEKVTWMRHVVGEEDCNGRVSPGVPRKRLALCDIRDPACQHIWAVLGKTGASNIRGNAAKSPDNHDECRCQPTAGPISKCYKMYYKGSRFGRCTPYICGAKYECVKDGGEELSKCVRRVMTSRIEPHPRYRRYCKKVTIAPTELYMLSGE